METKDFHEHQAETMTVQGDNPSTDRNLNQERAPPRDFPAPERTVRPGQSEQPAPVVNSIRRYRGENVTVLHALNAGDPGYNPAVPQSAISLVSGRVAVVPDAELNGGAVVGDYARPREANDNDRWAPQPNAYVPPRASPGTMIVPGKTAPRDGEVIAGTSVPTIPDAVERIWNTIREYVGKDHLPPWHDFMQLEQHYNGVAVKVLRPARYGDPYFDGTDQVVIQRIDTGMLLTAPRADVERRPINER